MGSSGNNFCVQWNNHQQNLLTVMSELLQNSTLTDVTLGVEDGRSVECHKTVLAACSSYFQTLFTQYPCKHPFVVLSGIKYPEIMRIVEFMYKGEVNVGQDELDAILKVAEALQVKGLIEANGWTPDKDLQSSPATNVNKPAVHPSGKGKSSRNRRKSSSPAQSSNKPHQAYDEPLEACQEEPIPSPIPSRHAWPISQGLPLGPQDLAASSAALQSNVPAGYPAAPETHYETAPEPPAPRIRKRKMSREHVINRGTPILRTALKQGHAGSSQQATPTNEYPEYHEGHYLSPANGSTSALDTERDDGHGSVDLSYRQPTHSPYATDTSTVNGDERMTVQSFTEDSKADIASYTPPQVHEGKRYKKYSKDDLNDAIQAVTEGMSANKAASLFKVPSRTLYDKIKKLGYTNSKNRRSGCSSSSASSSSACFPYGIGGNVDGSIYGNMMENDNDNGDALMENPANVLEASYAEPRDDSLSRESALRENDRKTRSPTHSHCSESPMPLQLQHQEPSNCNVAPLPDNQDNYENEAEDLSVNRRSEAPSLISPNVVIKEET